MITFVFTCIDSMQFSSGVMSRSRMLPAAGECFRQVLQFSESKCVCVCGCVPARVQVCACVVCGCVGCEVAAEKTSPGFVGGYC